MVHVGHLLDKYRMNALLQLLSSSQSSGQRLISGHIFLLPIKVIIRCLLESVESCKCGLEMEWMSMREGVFWQKFDTQGMERECRWSIVREGWAGKQGCVKSWGLSYRAGVSGAL